MNNKKILITFVSLALLGVTSVILEKTHVTNFLGSHPHPIQGPTTEQKAQDDEANANSKKKLIEEKAPDTSANNGDMNEVINLSTQIENNGTVTVFTKLTGYSNGVCRLTVTNDGKTTSQTADVIYQPEFSSCAGFSMPISSVGKGTWSLTLTVTSNGTSKSKTISAEVN